MAGKHGKGLTPEQLQEKADKFDELWEESSSHDPGYRTVGNLTVRDDPEGTAPRKRW